MNNIHICTNSSLQGGIDLPPTECPICKHNSFQGGWIDVSCNICGLSTEMYSCDVVRILRERMGVSRNDMAIKMGLKLATLKSYEWKTPSKKYYQKFLGFVYMHYKYE